MKACHFSFLARAGALLVSVAPTAVQGQFRYTTNAGAITITAYTGSGGAVNIPSQINGLFVTSIEDLAFYSVSGITSVTIPDSVLSIGNMAFAECGLTNVTIPHSVTHIGDNAFLSCHDLSNVTVGNNVRSMGEATFSDCVGLTSLVIGNSLTYIPSQAFQGCAALTSVQFPNSVSTIGDSAFVGSGLLSVTIPDTVTTIGETPFWACNSLTNVAIGSGLTNLGSHPFWVCPSLIAIDVSMQNPVYTSLNGVVFDKNQTTLLFFPQGLAGSYTIPNGVANISDNACAYCVGLTNVTIPGSVTNIGFFAFGHCGLTSVFFAGNAPATEYSAFMFYYNYPTDMSEAATAYYLTGASGWTANLASLPTALWLPQVGTGDGTFGVRSNRFGFSFSWAGGQTVVLEAATNLSNPAWIPVATNTLISGTSYFSDPEWTNFPGRFYRLTSP